MAEQNVTAQAAESNNAFRQRRERVAITHEIWTTILDPIMTFAELVRGYDHTKGIDGFNPEEYSAVLRLLVLGGYTETKLQCASGCTLNHVSGEQLEMEIARWCESVEGASHE